MADGKPMKTRMKRILYGLTLVNLTFLVGCGGKTIRPNANFHQEQRLRVKLYPQMMVAQHGGNTVRLTIFIPPDPRNKYVAVRIDQAIGDSWGSGWSLSEESPYEQPARYIPKLYGPKVVFTVALFYQEGGDLKRTIITETATIAGVE